MELDELITKVLDPSPADSSAYPMMCEQLLVAMSGILRLRLSGAVVSLCYRNPYAYDIRDAGLYRKVSEDCLGRIVESKRHRPALLAHARSPSGGRGTSLATMLKSLIVHELAPRFDQSVRDSLKAISRSHPSFTSWRRGGAKASKQRRYTGRTELERADDRAISSDGFFWAAPNSPHRIAIDADCQRQIQEYVLDRARPRVRARDLVAEILGDAPFPVFFKFLVIAWNRAQVGSPEAALGRENPEAAGW